METDDKDIEDYTIPVAVVLNKCFVRIINKRNNNKNGNIPNEGHFLLNPISLTIEGGKLFAILGGSGSGKTTLLNVLADRYDKNAFDVPKDGVIYRLKTKKIECNIGYVTQHDYLLPFLTVYETILFAKKLKHSQIDDDELVNNLIKDFGLKDCTNSIIGNDSSNGDASGKRGISGGEKRRVSIAVQVISKPQVLCADEPTSGLDSFTATNVIESLSKLCKGKNKTTVICSIHQPREDVFFLFDGILLLAKGGYPIYSGETKKVYDYFFSLGFQCPSDSNPADFYVDICSIDTRSDEYENKCKKTIKLFIDSYNKTNSTNIADIENMSVSLVQTTHSNDSLISYKLILTQLQVVIKRFTLNNYRDSSNIIGGITQVLFLSLIIMGIFWQLGDSLQAINSRSGLFYIELALESYILLLVLVERYSRDVKILDRELLDNIYHPSVFLAAHIISSIPQLLIQPILYSIPIYFGCNLRPGGVYFINFMFVNIALSFIINGLAWMCLSIHRSFSVASLLANTNFTFISITSGYLVSTYTIPVYVRWVKYLSFLNYSYQIVMSNEFSNRIFSGCESNITANCLQYEGNYILNSQNVGVDDYQVPWPVLISICIIYHTVSFLLLSYLRHPVTGSVGGIAHVNIVYDVDEASEIRVGDEVNIEITKNDELYHCTEFLISIDINQLNLFIKGKSPKQILYNINATIKPSRLVALMGGSGSGKTTLLNIIGGRIVQNILNNNGDNDKNLISSTSSSTYEGSGYILYNGKVLTGLELRSCMGYVLQFDFHFPSLTVFETLLFHASIKLPMSIKENIKADEVNKVINLLGLKTCANTRIGDDVVKGISGGEKRRLSMGISLLGNPSLCLFDEPTTGLDTFTARHIVETLKDLSEKYNKTVVMSIHQPRYDIFGLVDDVILLSKGKQVWAGDKSLLLQALNSIGFSCPELVNPADFILDISSIDLRESSKEMESKARLNTILSLIGNYNEIDLINKETEGVVESDEFLPNLKSLTSLAVSVVSFKKSEKKSQTRLEDKPFYFSLFYLVRRSFLNLLRQPILTSTRITQGLFFGLILCLFYAPIGNDQYSIQNRIGCLYLTTSLTFIGMLGCVAIYPIERDVFFKEYVDGGYSALSFFVTYFLLSAPFIFVSAIIYGFLMTYAIGFNPSGYGFVIFSYVVMTYIFVGECIGIAFCSIFLRIGMSINVMSIFISFFSIMAGLISLNMPIVFIYLSYASPMYWGSYVLANIVFQDQTFTCTTSQQTADGQCLYSTGDQVLATYNMDNADGTYGLNFHLQISAILCAIFFLIAYISFRIRAINISH